MVPNTPDTPSAPSGLASALAALPSLIMRARDGLIRHADGRFEAVPLNALADRLAAAPHILCHAKAVARRLNQPAVAGFDLLELFAFVRPARFCLPTVRGLADATGQLLDNPHDHAAQADAMPGIAAALIDELAAPLRQDRVDAAAIAFAMAEGGWPWGRLILEHLGMTSPPDGPTLYRAFAVWQKAPEWEERAPPPPPGQAAIDPPAARAQLDKLLSTREAHREARPQQADYASATAAAFRPRAAEGQPNLILAEAGTGVGKTLGYLAPASLWADLNEGPVWVATYTRNLQRQIDDELQQLAAIIPPDRVVVRKGRENFLCLLNFEEAIQRVATTPQNAVPLGLLTRWATASRDGALIAGDLPGWLTDLAGRGRTFGLADRRGECCRADPSGVR